MTLRPLPHPHGSTARGLAATAVAALALTLVPSATQARTTTGPAEATDASGSAASPSTSPRADGEVFRRTATYPVFQNLPAGVDPASETVAEISAVTPDGLTMIYTDAPGGRVGLIDLTDPEDPQGLGSIDLDGAEPTSVAVRGGFLLVVVDTSASFVDASGELRVFRLADRTLVRTIDLGGQPDSIALDATGTRGAVAIENERDEDLDDGVIPQAPAGFVQLLDLSGDDPAAWTATPLDLVGDPVYDAAAGVLTAPTDPEPEYVAISPAGTLAITLQENNGIVVADLATGEVERVFSAGSATLEQVDTTDDGVFNAVDTITEEREPDSAAWIDDRYLATADEGDYEGGSRGWTVFDTTTGEPAWEAGASFEHLVQAHGHVNDGRADNKGAEPEGLTVATIGGVRRAFVGSERSNLVAVYDVTDPTDPVLEQVLPTTNGPEGLLAVPERDLFLVSSEEDDASALVRATVTVHELGAGDAAYPQLVSADPAAGEVPVGWGALGALSAHPTQRGRLWAASDAAFSPGRLYELDTTTVPARVLRAIDVTDAAGAPLALDLEGLHANADGTFWGAGEGRTGPANRLVRIAADGRVLEEVALPEEVASRIANWGLEGVTAVGEGEEQVLFTVVQRTLWVDPAASPRVPLEGNVARVGRYDVAAGTWSWFTYPLATTTAPGDWIGLSEVVALDDDTLAVIERDKLNGPDAAFKRVYTVDVPAVGGSATEPVALGKDLAVDVLPALRAGKGWTQEKLEGLTVGGDRQVYVVTDNDGTDDATGETVFLPLGSQGSVFREALATRTGLRVADRTVRRGQQVRAVVTVDGAAAGSVVRLLDGRREVARGRVGEAGRTVLRARLPRGRYALRAVLVGTDALPGSRSGVVRVSVR